MKRRYCTIGRLQATGEGNTNLDPAAETTARATAQANALLRGGTGDPPADPPAGNTPPADDSAPTVETLQAHIKKLNGECAALRVQNKTLKGTPSDADQLAEAQAEARAARVELTVLKAGVPPARAALVSKLIAGEDDPAAALADLKKTAPELFGGGRAPGRSDQLGAAGAARDAHLGPASINEAIRNAARGF